MNQRDSIIYDQKKKKKKRDSIIILAHSNK